MNQSIINIKLSWYWYNRRPLYIMSDNLFHFHPTSVVFIPLTEICSSLEPSFWRLPIWKINMVFFLLNVKIESIQSFYINKQFIFCHIAYILLQTEDIHYFNFFPCNPGIAKHHAQYLSGISHRSIVQFKKRK